MTRGKSGFKLILEDNMCGKNWTHYSYSHFYPLIITVLKCMCSHYFVVFIQNICADPLCSKLDS